MAIEITIEVDENRIREAGTRTIVAEIWAAIEALAEGSRLSQPGQALRQGNRRHYFGPACPR